MLGKPSGKKMCETPIRLKGVNLFRMMVVKYFNLKVVGMLEPQGLYHPGNLAIA